MASPPCRRAKASAMMLRALLPTQAKRTPVGRRLEAAVSGGPPSAKGPSSPSSLALRAEGGHGEPVQDDAEDAHAQERLADERPIPARQDQGARGVRDVAYGVDRREVLHPLGEEVLREHRRREE